MPSKDSVVIEYADSAPPWTEDSVVIEYTDSAPYLEH